MTAVKVRAEKKKSRFGPRSRTPVHSTIRFTLSQLTHYALLLCCLLRTHTTLYPGTLSSSSLFSRRLPRKSRCKIFVAPLFIPVLPSSPPLLLPRAGRGAPRVSTIARHGQAEAGARARTPPLPARAVAPVLTRRTPRPTLPRFHAFLPTIPRLCATPAHCHS